MAKGGRRDGLDWNGQPHPGSHPSSGAFQGVIPVPLMPARHEVSSVFSSVQLVRWFWIKAVVLDGRISRKHFSAWH